MLFFQYINHVWIRSLDSLARHTIRDFEVVSVPREWLHLLPESPSLSRNATSWWSRQREGGVFNLTKSRIYSSGTYVCIVLIAVMFPASCFSQMYSMGMERLAWWRARIHRECGDLGQCSGVFFNSGSTKNTALGTPAPLSSAYQRHKCKANFH